LVVAVFAYIQRAHHRTAERLFRSVLGNTPPAWIGEPCWLSWRAAGVA
jgi:hypothetical protein